MPKFTAHWSTAAIQGRHFFGQVSERSDAERGEETEDHQLPPSLREERQAREQGVSQDGQDQRATTAEAVADDAEEGSAEGPAEQEGRLNPRAVERHGRVSLGDQQQLGHEDGGDERVEVQVEPIEEPAEPGGEAGLLLVGRQLAELRGFGGGVAHEETVETA
jgi:hypothetical protein